MSTSRTVRSSRVAWSALGRLADDTSWEYSVIISGRGTISRANEGLLRSSRRSQQALRGRPLSFLVRRTDGKVFAPSFLRPGSRANPQRKNFSVVSRDGKLIPCRGLAYYLEGRGPGEGGVLLLGRKVRSGGPRSALLLAGEGRDRPLLSAMRDGFCVVDREGLIVESNAALAGMAGMDAAEMAGMSPPFPWFGADDNRRLVQALKSVVRTGDPAQVMVVLERDEDAPLALSICITGFSGMADRFLAAVRDISSIVPVRESQMAGRRIERLSEQLQRNSVRLKTLQEINHAVLRSGSLPVVFRRITQGVRQLVDHDLAGIYVFDGDEKHLRPHTLSRVTPFTRRLGQFPLTPGKGIIGAAAISGETVLVNDAQHDPHSIYPPGLKPAVEHIIAAPLRGRTSTYGVLTVARNRHPGFNDEDALIVKSFADAASIAIDNIRLHADLSASGPEVPRPPRGLRPPITGGYDRKNGAGRLAGDSANKPSRADRREGGEGGPDGGKARD